MNNSLIVLTALLLLVFSACQDEAHQIKLQGKTMGTTYHITYWHSEGTNYQKQIDSALMAVNQSLSTYIENSIISIVNKADSAAPVDALMIEVYERARAVAEHTNGAFDYTVMPLVNAWGFGFEKSDNVDSLLIDSLMQFVGYPKVELKCDADNNCRIIKSNPGVMIDFSALAKGYGVDVVAELLENNKIKNYLVEIGGELRAAGKNGEKNWTIGIDQPEEDPSKRSIKAVMHISDIAVATSGNYRNFYMKDGIKYAHTIDPKTGYPALNDLLSVTVITKNCMIADAYATACMVLGLDGAMALIESTKGIEAYFIYRTNANQIETTETSGFKAGLAGFEENG